MRHTTAALRQLAVALLLVLATAGCQHTGPSRSSTALSLHERGDYAAAYREATAAHPRSTGRAQQEAALVAGMSAFELKRYDDAEHWLRPLARSSDREIAGRATATIGLVSVARGNYALAAIDLSSAGRQLTGQESARAHFFAGECYTLVGRLDAAQRSYALARGAAGSSDLAGRAGDRMVSGPYSVQFGAFTVYGNAESAASGARSRARGVGLEAPRIISTSDVNGRTLYLVHQGRYATKGEADIARVRLGGGAIVVPARDE